MTPMEPLYDELSLLETLVGMDSRTTRVEGVNAVQTLLARKLSALGFDVRRVPNPTHTSGDLLLAFRPGVLDETLTLIGHADTVLGPSSVHGFHHDRENGRATGPGIIDNKAGLVVMLSGLRRYFAQGGKPRRNLQVVISPNEEGGSAGFLPLFNQLGTSSLLNLGFEPALPDGSLIGSRNGNRWYKVQVEGIPAHAGRFGSPHLNAFHEFALSLGALHFLNDEAAKVRLNVGSLSAGTGHYNVVCGKVEAKIDARFPSFVSRDLLHTRLMDELTRPKLACSVTGQTCKVQVELEDDCPPMGETHAARLLAAAYAEHGPALEGRAVGLAHAGGAADVNHFATTANAGLDGLGAVGGDMHTTREWVETASLTSRPQMLARFLAHLDGMEDLRHHVTKERP